MQFILAFTISLETRDEALARFLETGGLPPGRGDAARALQPAASRCGDCPIGERGSQALTASAPKGSDVVEFTLAPVLEDQELLGVPQPARQPSASAAVHVADSPPETYPEDTRAAPETTLRTTKPPDNGLA
jgi:hypothetical protein